ncbi:MAG: flavodoxin-dependent (E)-4-hydroxy-3-methylbut-2-enyl-diphosphate synthase [Clostridia bacterium]|nr:flavodoxin-dependent (E)-4-hydroxy-3-methylbut-2-enyl-diphosphate synthase [Clostridia bacterium]
MKYNDYRRRTREVTVGGVRIGGTAPISIQSMTNTDTHDIEATYRQVAALAESGCDIVRITAPDIESVDTFAAIKSRGVTVPLVADIHFNYKIAVAAARAGVDKIRINPGNIGSRDKVREVVLACRERGIPIRIGVNSGSLEESILKKHGSPTAKALAESALYHASILQELDFQDILISVKSSDVQTMIQANRILAEKTDFPLHLGVTEAGAGDRAIVKSSIGIGTLLAEGIGDTLRVSLTDNPIEEISAARRILDSLSLSAESGMDIISCPTCGRTKIDLIPIFKEFKARAKSEGLDRKNIKVALMGCAVNGPGEAREADIGIAGGVGEALLFKKGEIIRKIDEKNIVDELIAEIKKM